MTSSAVDSRREDVGLGYMVSSETSLLYSSVFPSISPHAYALHQYYLLYETHNLLTSTCTGTCVQLDRNPPIFYHAASAAHATAAEPVLGFPKSHTRMLAVASLTVSNHYSLATNSPGFHKFPFARGLDNLIHIVVGLACRRTSCNGKQGERTLQLHEEKCTKPKAIEVTDKRTGFSNRSP